MTGEQFCGWLEEMRRRFRAGSDAQAARLLGVDKGTVLRWKREGCDRRTALACQALVHWMEPYQ